MVGRRYIIVLLLVSIVCLFMGAESNLIAILCDFLLKSLTRRHHNMSSVWKRRWNEVVGLSFVATVHLCSHKFYVTQKSEVRDILCYLIYLRGTYKYSSWREQCGFSQAMACKFLPRMKALFLSQLREVLPPC